MQISASLMTYKNNFKDLKIVINCFLATELDVKLYIIDNSPTDKIKYLMLDTRIEYIYNGKNLGFGKAHNIAIKKAINSNSEYHLILNPDLYFEKGVLEMLYQYISNHSDIGIITPKVLFPDESFQYQCKMLPTPLNLIGRRFIPIKKYVAKLDYKYDMKFLNYNKTQNVPCLVGCFIFIKTKIFEEIGMFDEKYFMYMEDIDISRRVAEKYRIIYYPKAIIYHKLAKGSYKNFNLLIHHIKSAIYYFNKWGWFFDKKRTISNKNLLNGVSNEK